MKIKKLTLLLTLVVLLVGVAAASEVSNDTNTENTNTIIQDTQTTTNIVNSTVNEDKIENKQILKEEKNNKTASKTYDISDFNSLNDALTSDEYDTVTVNIKSNIKLNNYIKLNDYIETVTINGNGKTINGNNSYQFLTIDSDSTVTIKNLKITNCYTDDYGGAIDNGGNLTITNTTLNNNTAWFGGAISNYAILTINNSTLNNNTADHGGSISNTAKLEINNSQFKYNIAEFGNGGAIENKATLTINNSTLNNNTATYTGGAIYNRDNANMTMNNTTLNNNTANCGGAISNYAILTINNSTLNNNYAYDWGGAVYNNATLTINNSTLNNNKADYGGAIFNRVNITINSCTLNYNKAEDNGGAIYIESTGYLYIQNNTLKYSINIENNTFSKNNAENGAGIYVYSDEYDCKELKTRWVEGHYESGSYYDIYGVEVHYNKWVEGHYEEYYVPISNISNHFIKIQKNIFRQNKANATGKAIIKYKNATISNNTNAETSKYSGTIYINWPNVQIKNNIFYDEIIYTKTITSAVNGIIGEKLTLKATVTDTNNKKVNEGNLIFKLNGITIKDNGKLTGSKNPLKVKVVNGVATATVIPDLDMRNANKLTAKYVGTDNYNASESSQVKIQVSQRNASIVVSSNVKTIKQGQVLTITAKVYDTTNGKKSTNLVKYADEFVYFKVNGITLKDSKGAMQKVKVVNGTATIKYIIPLGLSGVTDGKTFTVKNHTILAGFYNKNYLENIRNTSTFQVERSNITITISNATVNNRTHKLSLTATIKDYLGNKVVGPNKCIIKVNGVTLKNGTQPIYYFASYGVLNIKNINIPAYNKYTIIEIVTQDRLAYKSQRNTTTKINIIPKEELKVVIANKTYDLVLNNNTAGSEFKKLLPQTYAMSELNGNEKYVYLNTSLTSNPVNVGKINAGDLMLYQNNCIVLFYKTFNTTYSYTPLGHVNNLGDLGSSDVIVKFVKG